MCTQAWTVRVNHASVSSVMVSPFLSCEYWMMTQSMPGILTFRSASAGVICGLLSEVLNRVTPVSHLSCCTSLINLPPYLHYTRMHTCTHTHTHTRTPAHTHTHTQTYIFNNTKLLVRLCAAKIDQDWFILLDLLARAFNPHCK